MLRCKRTSRSHPLILTLALTGAVITCNPVCGDLFFQVSRFSGLPIEGFRWFGTRKCSWTRLYGCLEDSRDRFVRVRRFYNFRLFGAYSLVKAEFRFKISSPPFLSPRWQCRCFFGNFSARLFYSLGWSFSLLTVFLGSDHQYPPGADEHTSAAAANPAQFRGSRLDLGAAVCGRWRKSSSHDDPNMIVSDAIDLHLFLR